MAGTDPYVPGHGDARYAVEHYRLALEYKVATNHLDGRATLTVVVREATSTIALDLYGLAVAKVLVDGKRPDRFVHKDRKLKVRLAARAKSGQRLTVVVDYAGKPRPLPSLHGPVGWEELSDGALVAAQPCGAPTWFPCNDRPDDKASYDIAVTAPNGYRVVANGTLAETSTKAGRTTWRYLQPQPMAAYLAAVHVGRYTTTAVGDCLEIVHPRGLAVTDHTAFARQADMLAAFTELFGPYPFDGYRAVVTPDDLEIPLEAQTLATFGANHTRPGWENERLVAHELAHQWFGNSLTVTAWPDIWLHEGFACYSEWLWSEASGGRPVADHVREHHERLRKLPQDLVLGAPGRADMFDDRVYKRGALTVHAVRLLLGEQFFPMLRAWTGEHRWGAIDTPLFIAHVQRFTAQPVGPLFDAWVHAAPLPEITASAP
jgi:aminopeptidase N